MELHFLFKVNDSGKEHQPPHRCKRGTPPDEKSGQALLAGGETFVLPGLFAISKYEIHLFLLLEGGEPVPTEQSEHREDDRSG